MKTYLNSSILRAVTMSMLAGVDLMGQADRNGVVQPAHNGFAGGVNFKKIGDISGSSGGTAAVATTTAKISGEDHQAGVTGADGGQFDDSLVAGVVIGHKAADNASATAYQRE